MKTSTLVIALVLAIASCKRADDSGRSLPAAAMAAAPTAVKTVVAPPIDEPPRGTMLTLLYSSNLHGEYEPCG